MKKLRRILAAAGLWAMVLSAGCSGSSDSLSEQIRLIVADPELQSEEGLEALSRIIREEPKKYKAYLLPDGTIDLKRLAETVERVGSEESPDFSWDIAAYGGVLNSELRLNLFLERSGSMQGYDSRSGSGYFKSTLTELINRFPRVEGERGKLLIVNDAIYPWKGDFKQFLQERDIFAATADYGNPSYTDFARIFEYVLTDSVAEDVNVLVTDMIYSPRGTDGVSAEKILAEERAIASALFRDHADKSVIVVKMNSDFSGLYYPYNSPNSGVNYRGNRPYYIIVTGSAAAMHRLRTDERYASWRDFKSLPGYEADYFFNRAPLTLPYYSILPRGKASRGTYQLEGGGEKGNLRALRQIKPEADGTLTFQIAADLSGVPATDEYLADTRNYMLSGASAQITGIKKLTPEDTDARNRRYLEPATHLFTVTVDRSHPTSELKISLANTLPEWVAQSHSRDDRNTAAKSFRRTTFGINDFMEGIFSAYHGSAATPEFFAMRVKFNN